MARHRSKPKKPKGKPRDLGGHGTWQSPREQYVYSPEPVSLRDLAEAWKGHKGCSTSNIMQKCSRQRWEDRRKEYQARTMQEAERKFLEKDSDRRSRLLEKASEQHQDLARMWQQTSKELNVIGRMRSVGGAVCTACKRKVSVVCTECGEEVKVPSSKISATDAYRTGIRAMKDGVEVDRKALGIADRIEVDYRTTEIVREVIQVLEVVVTDADMMQEIMYRLRQVGAKEREELKRLTAGGEVVDITPK